LKVKKNDNARDNKIELWLRAAQSAKQEIARSKARIRQLEDSVRVFEQNYSSGEPWPKENTGN
jgi:hypothetical protein